MPKATQLIGGRAETGWKLLDTRSYLCPPTTLGMAIIKMSIHVHMIDASRDLSLSQINNYNIKELHLSVKVAT